jgi:hypothetical protein
MSEIGNVYGRLTVIAPGTPTKRGLPRWRVACSCGAAVRTVAQSDLRSGHTRSCGCYRVETTKQHRTIHGAAETLDYGIWLHMIGRCHCRTDHKYPDYGGRGIVVCDEWRRSFEAFRRDVGTRPSLRHSIERIDNNGNYEPGNCRWALGLEQAQNKRSCVYVALDGAVLTTSEAARRMGISTSTILACTRRLGITHQEATDWLARKWRRRHVTELQQLQAA